MGTERGHRKVGERTIRFEGRVTNVYRREDDAWKIVHHHTDFSSAMVEALGGPEESQEGSRRGPGCSKAAPFFLSLFTEVRGRWILRSSP